MKPNIDPKVDCVFKVILGSEAHKRLLVHFLNAVLARDAGIRLRDVELLNPYNEREFESDKLSVVDVKARDEAGRWYQIEIQLMLHAGLTARMLHTWSAIYHSQLRKGDPFTALQPVIAIWLLNEPLFAIPGAYYLPFAPWNREHHLLLSDDMRIDLLQLSAWPGPRATYDELDRWLCLFREGEQVDLDAPPAILQSQEMKEAMDVLQHFSENQRDYLLYQQRLDAARVEATWKTELEQAQRREAQAALQAIQATQRAEQACREKEQAKQREEQAKQREEQATQRAEQERREKEQAKDREEQERQEKERLLQLLTQAGIDPKQGKA